VSEGKIRKTRRERPAETATAGIGAIVAAALALLNVKVSPDEAALIVAAVAAIPAVVTYLVNLVRSD
jgi:hypothetical protein